LILLVELVVIVGGQTIAIEEINFRTWPTPSIDKISNTEALGELFYTHYIYLFQAAGMILLVAMVGAIVLTHRHRQGARKQQIHEQVNRRDSIEIVKVEIGKGI
jgi:NADH-quinone oxidoreductase subunit J